MTSCDGLFFLGLPWQHTWGSGRFSGVAGDAAYLADQISEGLQRETAQRHGRRDAGPREVHWLAGTPASTWPRDEEWAAPRTVA